MKFTTQLIKFDTTNLNGRRYSSDKFKNEIREWHKTGFEVHESTLLEKCNGYYWYRNTKTNERTKHETTQMFGQIGYPENLDINLKAVSHTISNFRINEDNWLEADVEILDTDSGILLKKLLGRAHSVDLTTLEPSGSGLVFRPQGTGEVVDGEVVNYTITAFNAIPVGEDAFKDIELSVSE